MNHFDSKILPLIVTDEWLAKTYSEYLYSCADDQAEINNDISDACTDPTLEALVDFYRGVWDDEIEVIRKDVTAAALVYGCTLEEIQNREGKFIEFSLQYQPSNDALSAANHLNQVFDQAWDGSAAMINAYVTEGIIVDDEINKLESVTSAIDDLASDIMTKYRLDDDYKYGLQDGFVNFKDMVKQVITHSNLDLTTDIDLERFGSLDQAIGSESYILSDIIESLKDSASSSIAWAQGFASCAIENVTDRLTNFTNVVQTTFSSIYTQAKESFNNVKSLLAQTNMNVRSFINTAEDMLGIRDLIDSNKTIGQTDVSSYTGASPWSSMDLHTAKGIANVTTRVVGGAIAGIWQGIKKVGSKLWGKIRPYIKALTDDPEDIKVIDSDANSYQVENWMYQGSNKVTVPFTDSEAFASWLSAKFPQEKTVTYDTYFGTIKIIVDDIYSEYILDPQSQTIIPSTHLAYTYQMKPKCINYKAALAAGIASALYEASEGYVTVNTLPTTSDYLATQMDKFLVSGDMYLNDDAPEGEKLLGFQYGLSMLLGVLFSANRELADQSNAYNGWRGYFLTYQNRGYDNQYWNFYDPAWVLENINISWWRYVPDDGTITGKPRSVTNRNFLQITSGYQDGTEWASTQAKWLPYTGTGEDFNMYRVVVGPDAESIPSLSSLHGFDAGVVANLMAAIFILQQHDRFIDPVNYMYVPYSTDNFEFADPRYQIKCDSENANIADALASIILIVAVVAIVVIVGYKISRSIKKSKFKKWTTIKGQLDQDIWNGKTLTKKEWKKYLRADRKLSKMNLWTAGSAASSYIPSGSSSIPTASFGANMNGASDYAPADSSNTSESLILTILRSIAPLADTVTE